MRLGVATSVKNANFLRHTGVWVNRSGTSEFLAYGSDENGPWLGYQAVRSDFDSLLLAQARACRVTVLQPHRALQVLYEEERVSGAVTTAGTIHSTFTVDASGSSGWRARQQNMP
jgi:flavin-dependent dehydrogenase